MIGTLETRAAVAVDEGRLWGRLMTMASYGALANGGVNRQALSSEDIAARRQIKQWADACGFELSTDKIGNLFVRRSGSDSDAEPVLTGSHMDSQPKGGKFDGIYGVLAGLEAICALQDAGVKTRRPIEVVAWMNEEGSRFRPGVMGSSVFVDRLSIDNALAVVDADGVTVEAALAVIREAEPDIPVRDVGFQVDSYIEAHIEQGPILESTGKTIGVVTGIQGLRWFDVEVLGREDHAGTTPLKTRKDALIAATRIVSELRRVLEDPEDVVRFTVGQFEAFPGSPNTVPGRVIFTIDLRHPDGAIIDRLSTSIRATCGTEALGCQATIRQTMDAAPTTFADEMVATVRRHTEALGLSHMDMPSGAGHDAMHMQAICPTGMVFIPCENGISHNEAESATPGDCADGARVVAACLAELANR